MSVPSLDQSIADIWRADPLIDFSIINKKLISVPKGVIFPASPGTVQPSLVFDWSFQEGEYMVPKKTYFWLKFLPVNTTGNVVDVTQLWQLNNAWRLCQNITVEINGQQVDLCQAPGLQAHINKLLFDKRSEIVAKGAAELYFPLETSLGTQASENAIIAADGTLTPKYPSTGAVVATLSPLLGLGIVGDSQFGDIPTVNQQAVKANSALVYQNTVRGTNNTQGQCFVKMYLKDVLGIFNINKAVPISRIRVTYSPQTNPTAQFTTGRPVDGGTITLGAQYTDMNLVMEVVKCGRQEQAAHMARLSKGEKVVLNFTKFTWQQFSYLSNTLNITQNLTLGSSKLQYLVVYPQQNTVLIDQTRYHDGCDIVGDFQSNQVQFGGSNYPDQANRGINAGYTDEMYALREFSGLSDSDSWVSAQRFGWIPGSLSRLYVPLVYDLRRSEEKMLTAQSNQLVHNLTWKTAPDAGSTVNYNYFGYQPAFYALDFVTGNIDMKS